KSKRVNLLLLTGNISYQIFNIITMRSCLTLVLIPGLLAIVNDWRRVIGRMKTGVWLEREAVEPAAARRVDRMV
ncbi:hypothetical protein VU04_12000, partial [Desulfobulbus sp. TB]|nr:hypothetical protein [Desulfobulbus sp. TB]